MSSSSSFWGFPFGINTFSYTFILNIRRHLQVYMLDRMSVYKTNQLWSSLLTLYFSDAFCPKKATSRNWGQTTPGPIRVNGPSSSGTPPITGLEPITSPEWARVLPHRGTRHPVYLAEACKQLIHPSIHPCHKEFHIGGDQTCPRGGVGWEVYCDITMGTPATVTPWKDMMKDFKIILRISLFKIRLMLQCIF